MRLVAIGPGRHRVEGELDLAGARLLEHAVRALPRDRGALTFELQDLELRDGPACAAAVDAFRGLAARGVRVTLVGAPQALAHVLYRVAALPSIVLVDPRFEEPTSS
jgi:hypothetical protein